MKCPLRLGGRRVSAQEFQAFKAGPDYRGTLQPGGGFDPALWPCNCEALGVVLCSPEILVRACRRRLACPAVRSSKPQGAIGVSAQGGLCKPRGARLPASGSRPRPRLRPTPARSRLRPRFPLPGPARLASAAAAAAKAREVPLPATEMASLLSLQEENQLLQQELSRVEDLLAQSCAERNELAIKYNAVSERVGAA
nr:uncharacterized protein LOC119621367 isoform X1 [Chlorocebus sabaeus]